MADNLIDLCESSDDESMQPPLKKQKLIPKTENENHASSYYQRMMHRIGDISTFEPSLFDANQNEDEDIDISFAFNPNQTSHLNRIRRENTTLKRKLRESSEKLRIIKNIASSNQSPNYSIISISKSNGLSSVKIGLLRKRIMHHYNKKRFKISIKDTAQKQYKSAIKLYLQHNKSSHKDPYIVYKKTGNNHYKFKEQSDLFELRDEEEAVQSNEVGYLDRVRFENQRLFSKRKISENVCIGEYFGLQMTENEMDRIYDHSKQRTLANLYAFEVQIDEDEINQINVSDDESESETDDEEDEYDEMDNEQKKALLRDAVEELKQNGGKFIIDGLGYQSKMCKEHLLMYAADCRDNPLSNEVSEEDERRQNVEFVTAVVNGWPRKFCVTSRKIERDQAIFGYFGEQFTKAKYQSLQDKALRMRIIVKIDSILQMNLTQID